MKHLLPFAALFALAACQQGQPGGAGHHFAMPEPGAHDTWQLVQGHFQGKALNLAAHNAPITLVISKDGFSGKSPVNQYNAPADISGNSVKLTGDIMTTRMASDAAAMHLESDYLQALRSAHTLQRNGNQLILNGEQAQLQYTLQSAPLAPQQ